MKSKTCVLIKNLFIFGDYDDVILLLQKTDILNRMMQVLVDFKENDRPDLAILKAINVLVRREWDYASIFFKE